MPFADSLTTLLLLAAAQQPPPKPAARALAQFSAEVEELAANLSPSVVEISVRGRAVVNGEEEGHTAFVAEQRSTGSGAIVDSNGYIVTNAHVVEGARVIDVRVMDRSRPDRKRNHRHYPAKIVGTDKETDLAVIKIEATGLPALQFRDSDTLRQGEIVVAMGSPLGLENSLTLGFVSATARQLHPDRPLTYIQTDAPINPGNSGGPLLDIDGRIAGINTLILSQSGGNEGIGFAIPSNLVRQVYAQLRKEGHAHHGVIGVVSQDISPELAAALGIDRHPGVIIADVRPHSAAEAAGLQPGDVLLALNGKNVTEGRQLMAAVFRAAVGDRMTLSVLRDGQTLDKEVVVTEKPRSPGGLLDLVSSDSHLVRELGILALTLDGNVTPLLPDLQRLYGVVVAAIPAEFAGLNPGLSPGDVIYELNRTPVHSLEELRAELAKKKSADPIALLVEHEGSLGYLAFRLE